MSGLLKAAFVVVLTDSMDRRCPKASYVRNGFIRYVIICP
jgi:hypothetical protein